jgi:AcrR family transcriptional regulator
VSTDLEPRTKRGLATRATLLAAAREVFERDGFLAARSTDIAAQAGVASGTFYTYFKDKEEAFDAVFAAAEEEMLHPHVPAEETPSGPRARIETAHRAYLVAYRKNAKLMAVINQVAAIDDHYRVLMRKRSEAFVRRNASWIEHLQEEGLADRELDAYQASRALSGMVSRLAHSTYVLGQKTPLETLVETLTALWVNALRIPPDA